MNKFVSVLLASRNQAQVFHWQTKSFAVHKATEDYYDAISGIVDNIVESYQGKYGILKNFDTATNIKDIETTEQIIQYFEQLVLLVEESRKELQQDSYLQNQVDEIVELLHSTIYKLKFLM